MGLFDKKYCDICGEKIGLLGNRKLEDGNLCKDCARKLSPFFNERRHSTVDEIKAQLAYREENEKLLDDFHPDKTYGSSTKVYVDTAARKFIVTYRSDWRSANPDLISFDMVKNVQTDIDESRDELYYKDENGERKSYSPPRYQYEYAFNLKILVDSPYFDEISFELSDTPRPESPYSPEYHQYELQMHELTEVITGRANYTSVQNGTSAQAAPQAGTSQACTASAAWVCSCGATANGKFCPECGSPKPTSKPRFCQNCGWKTPDPDNIPKFCPECGTPIDR